MGYQRYVMEAKMKDISSEERLDLDTHADTCVAGANTVGARNFYSTLKLNLKLRLCS